MSIYDSLNGPQKEAVITPEGPVLILAGAGSGKTRVLTHRIAYLIQEKHVPSYHILAITFTNKAAEEMRERVDRLLPGMEGAEVWVSTFHSMCVKILRRYIDRLGYDTNFTIYDPDDQKTVMKGVLKRLNIDTKTLSEKTALNFISDCKNKFINEVEFGQMAADFREKKLAAAYAEYQKDLRLNNALDFDDLLVKTVELFRDAPEVLETYQRRFEYIHVDEYQDTNTVQFHLVAQLAGSRKNLCVVGDDDQSIYKFRGADITNILSFEKTFPGAKVIKLEQNYRSTPAILDVANAVIAHNKGRTDKRLWSDREQGDPVKFVMYENQKEEAMEVIRDIISHVNEGEQYGDIAILYRTNAQSRSFEEACLMCNMPYRVVGGVNFYRRAEIKDILGYLKTIANGQDDVAVRRIVNMPKRGIGDSSLEKVAQYAQEEGLSLFEGLQRVDFVPGVGRAASKINGFVNQIRVLRAKADELPMAELIQAVYNDIEYETELLKLDQEQAETKRENIRELISKAAEYDRQCEEEGVMVSLNSFLEEVALVADIDSMDDEENRVVLMTLHGAKGLEFERVYLAGLEEDLFPSFMSIASDDPTDIEEERRLAYVGLTRAKTHLTLTAASTRMQNGEMQFHKVSRFVKEIPDGMLEMSGTRSGAGGVSFGGGFSSFRSTGLPVSNRFAGASGRTTGTGSMGGFGTYTSGGVNRTRSYEPHDDDSYARPKKRPSVEGTNPGYGKDIASLLKGQGAPISMDYGPGDRVVHATMGEGVVVAIEGSGNDRTVTVDFDDRGRKKMKAIFAKLQKK